MNTNVTTSYWDFEEGEVKCFTTELVSSKNLEKLFTLEISAEQIEKLKDQEKHFNDMLEQYQQYTKLSDVEMEMLTKGYTKRIDCFENVIKKEKCL